MPYLQMSRPRATTGMLAGEPKNQTPFTTPVLPKQAPTAFQQPYTQAQVDRSLAANPNASTGAYTGAVMPDQYKAPSTSASSSQYDPTTDPIYQKIAQLGTRDVSQAVAGGDALRKQILIQLGDPTFASQQMFGDPNAPVYGDANTTAAAAANPYSTVAGLGNTHVNNDANIDTAANKAGLYYSSTHANQLGDENQAYNQNPVNADNDAGTQLSGIVQQILTAQNNAQGANIDAAGTATQNAINNAISQGFTVTIDPTTGEPIFTPPTGGGNGATTTGATGGTTDPGAGGGQTPNTTGYDPITQAIINSGLTKRQGFMNFSGVGV